MRSNPPEIAVVVLSVGARPELAMAVDALLAQTIKAEIVVVNSGGGDPHVILPNDVPNLRIISVPDLLWPGAARNLGIQSSTAPWVAFIASDMIALRNWLEVRMEFHKQGHNAVAGSVINSHPRNLFAWASHVSILVRRLPNVPRRHVNRYSGSFARTMFAKYGKFREDLRIGEDTEFNRRLKQPDKLIWVPAAQTIHLNPTTFRAMTVDMFARGKRYGFHWSKSTDKPLVVRIFSRFMSVFPLATRSVRGVDRIFVWTALPLVLLCNIFIEMGVSAGHRELARQMKSPARSDGEN